MATTTADLYDQLTWLAKSGLPLPEGLARLAASLRDPTLARALAQLSRDTAAGLSLAEAMRRQPNCFSPLAIELVATGERSGSLAAVLGDIAELARKEVATVQRLREGLVYPLLTILMALWIYFGILYAVIPKFGRMFDEMMAGEPLPGLTELILDLSRFVVNYWPVIVPLLLLLTGALLWLVCAGRGALASWMYVLRVLPGGQRLALTLDYARISAVLGHFSGHGVPWGEGLRLAATVVESPHLQRTLAHWQTQIAAGVPLVELVTSDPRVDELFALTVRHAPETNLPATFASLAAHLSERADRLRARLVALFLAATVPVCAMVVGATVMAMFAPLIKLIDSLGGGGG